jgi:hypothetical protein
VLLEYGKREVMTCPDGEQLMSLVPCFGENPIEIGPQGLDVRLHSNPGAPFRPGQFFRKFCQPGLAPLRPGHQRLAQNDLPFPERVPDIPIRASEAQRGVADGAALGNGSQQIEQGIAHIRAALLPWLERVSKMQAELLLSRALFGCFGRFHPSNVSRPRQNFTVTEASRVRGAPRCATRFPVLAPVILLGPMVDQ